jgi:hypothetical protein
MVLYNGNAEVVGNFRALNFYKASDIRIKEELLGITFTVLAVMIGLYFVRQNQPSNDTVNKHSDTRAYYANICTNNATTNTNYTVW